MGFNMMYTIMSMVTTMVLSKTSKPIQIEGLWAHNDGQDKLYFTTMDIVSENNPISLWDK